MCCDRNHGPDWGLPFVLLGALVVVVARAVATVAVPLAVVAAVAAWRWLSGAPMWGAAATVLGGWPRWQRAVARVAVTVPAVAALWWPWQVATVVATCGSATCLAALESRRRAAARREPIRVVATVGQPAAAVCAGPAMRVDDLVREREEVSW